MGSLVSKIRVGSLLLFSQRLGNGVEIIERGIVIDVNTVQVNIFWGNAGEIAATLNLVQRWLLKKLVTVEVY